MKRFNKIFIGISLITITLISSGCGQVASSTASTPTSTVTGTTTSLTSTTTTTTASSCVPISQSIAFNATSIQIDSSGDLYGGSIPSSSTYGAITVGSTSAITGTTFTGYDDYSAGTLQLIVPSYTTTTTAASGSLSISATDQQLIISNASSSSYGITTTPCVSGIAIQGRLYTSNGNIFSGNVYLYLNGTVHGVELSF